MMVVIIPHPTEELKLIKFQKELIRQLNTDSKVYYAHQTLWLKLSENFSASTKSELKAIGQSISQINFFPPEYQNDDVVIPVMIDGTKFFLPLVHLYKKNGNKGPESNSLPSLPSCPVSSLKIFRIAISEQLSENSQVLTDSVWIKL